MGEIRFAARTLRRAPGFTFVAIASLALGLALAASTTAVTNAYLIRSLPYPAAHRLYAVIYAPPGQPEPRGLTAIDWKPLDDIVEVADGSAITRFYLTGESYTQEAMGLTVAPGALEALGVHAALGRSFQDDDFSAGSELVALIGDALWRDRFGSDPAVIGRSFRASLNDQAGVAQTFRIVGVLPPEFRYVRELWRDMELLVPLRSPMRAYMVRLREGVPAAFAERRITDAAKSAASSIPPGWGGVRLESVHGRYVAGLRPVLLAVTGAAALVLVIVCANVGVLMLLRAAWRQKEVGVRVALGAGRMQIFRMLAMESCLICAAALAAGLALTGVTLRFLAPLIEEHLGRPAPGGTSAIAVDPTVLVAAGSAGVLIAFSLSLAPLLTPWQRRLADTLRQAGRTGTDSPYMRKIRSLLIAFEIAGSLALLAGCGLMIRSAVNLLRTDLGFNIEQIVRARLALPQRTYPDAQALVGFYERFTERLSASSSSQVALTNWPPFYQTPFQRMEADAASTAGLEVGVTAVSADYFSILGIGLKQGRGFTRGDRVGAEPVAVISETLAQRLWPNGDAIGRRIRTGEQPAARSRLGAWRTVVGVAADVRQAYTDNDLQEIYIPFFQAPNQYAPVFIRSGRPASFWLATLRAAVGEIDPDVLISGVNSMKVEGDRLVASTRFLTSILTGFAIFAALLAVFAIYGVTAYAAQQREREVAIRIALGATRSTVVRMFLKEGIIVLAFGIAFGLLGAAAVARMLESQLYGVQPFDASTLAAAAGLLTAAALLAAWRPAKRAAAKDPLEALKEI